MMNRSLEAYRQRAGRLKSTLAVAASNRPLHYFLIAIWLIAIWSSPLYIAPGSDDGAHILQGLGTAINGSVSVKYFDVFHEVFIGLPSYTYLTGVFYNVWSLFGLPINYFTFGAFHFLVVSGLLIASVCFLRVTAQNQSTGIGRANIFLAALGASPFVLDMPHLRPEPAGILATVAAALAYHYAAGATKHSALLFALAGFLIGLAMTMHPTLTVASGVVALAAIFITLRKGAIKFTVLATASGLVVPAVILFWYLRHYPTSFEMLMEHVSTRSPSLSGMGQGWTNMVAYATMQLPTSAGVATKLYYATIFTSLIIAIMVAIFMTVRAFMGQRRIGLLGDSRIIGLVFFIAVLVNTSIDRSARLQIYSVLSFAAIWVAVSFLDLWTESSEQVQPGGKKAISFSLVICASAMVVAVLFNPITHISKRVLLEVPRYSGTTANSRVRQNLRAGDAVFSTNDRFLVPFIDLAEKTYRQEATVEAFWILPFVIGNKDLEQRTVGKLVCYVEQRAGKNIIWGLAKRNITNFASNKDRLSIRISTRYRILTVDFNVSENYYEFHDGLYVRGVIERIGAVAMGAEAEEEILYPGKALAKECAG